MTFDEIFTALKEGKKIRRTSWPIGEFIQRRTYINPYMLLDGLFADDWLIHYGDE